MFGQVIATGSEQVDDLARRSSDHVIEYIVERLPLDSSALIACQTFTEKSELPSFFLIIYFSYSHFSSPSCQRSFTCVSLTVLVLGSECKDAR